MQNVPVAVDQASPSKCKRCQVVLGDFQSRHLCPSCGLPQPLALDEDYFSALGVARQFQQNLAELEKHFYQVSRALHPDRFTTSDAESREFSLKRMSFLNEAYQTLKSAPLRREYFLELFGLKQKESSENKPSNSMQNMPIEMAETWFEVQDLLTENSAEAKAKLAEFESSLEAVQRQSESVVSDLERSYDQSPKRELLEKLAQELQKQSYHKSLQRDVERIKKNAYSD